MRVNHDSHEVKWANYINMHQDLLEKPWTQNRTMRMILWRISLRTLEKLWMYVSGPIGNFLSCVDFKKRQQTVFFLFKFSFY